MFRKCFEASYSFFYAQRGRDSSHFSFIPTFGLNWDCFEVDFGLSLGRFLCHVMACFVALIRTVLWSVLWFYLGWGYGLFNELFWVKIRCTIANYNVLKHVRNCVEATLLRGWASKFQPSGTQLRKIWLNCITPAHL